MTCVIDAAPPGAARKADRPSEPLRGPCGGVLRQENCRELRKTERRAVRRAAIRGFYVAVARPPVRRACGDRHAGRRPQPLSRSVVAPSSAARHDRRTESRPLRVGSPIFAAPSGHRRHRTRRRAPHLHSALPWGFSTRRRDRSRHPTGHRRARRWWWPSDVPKGAVQGLWVRLATVG